MNKLCVQTSAHILSFAAIKYTQIYCKKLKFIKNAHRSYTIPSAIRRKVNKDAVLNHNHIKVPAVHIALC